jgi:hypothetical protein
VNAAHAGAHLRAKLQQLESGVRANRYGVHFILSNSNCGENFGSIDVWAVDSLEQAVATVAAGTLYLPADASTGTIGDIYATVPAGRDWKSRQHGGSTVYRAQLAREGSQPDRAPGLTHDPAKSPPLSGYRGLGKSRVWRRRAGINKGFHRR